MDNYGEIIIYQTVDGLTKIDVSFENDTVWLSKSQMRELFQRDRSVISKHISHGVEVLEIFHYYLCRRKAAEWRLV